MAPRWAWLVAMAAMSVAGAAGAAETVVTLSGGNFTSFAGSADMLVLEFYAPVRVQGL